MMRQMKYIDIELFKQVKEDKEKVIYNKIMNFRSNKKEIFLGGTYYGYNWCSELISKIDAEKYNYFNPIVFNWNGNAKQVENDKKKSCDIYLYAITPYMTGVYSIAEVINDVTIRPDKVIFATLNTDTYFDKKMMNSLKEVGKMVSEKGGKVFNDMDLLVTYLNNL